MTVKGRGQRGFTVLEALIASFILVFGVASTAALFVGLASQTTVSRRATEAAAVAAQELETLRDLRYEDIASASASTRTVGTTIYTLERLVTANDPAPNMKRIRVTVSWNSRGARSYVVETIYTNLRQ